MGIARYNIERMLPEKFERMEKDKSQSMKNCSILHYSRCNPEDATDVREKLSWRRIVRPTDVDNSPFGGQWVELAARPKYTGAQLLSRSNARRGWSPVYRGCLIGPVYQVKAGA